MERKILKNRIEIASLEKEEDPLSRSKKKRLETDVHDNEKERTRLIGIWEKEKAELEKLKKAKIDLEKARNDLKIAQGEGSLARAGELQYSIIPLLEEQLMETSRDSAEGNRSQRMSRMHWMNSNPWYHTEGRSQREPADEGCKLVRVHPTTRQEMVCLCLFLI